jgi:hypothetical protein
MYILCILFSLLAVTVVTPTEVIIAVVKSFWTVHAVSFASDVTTAKAVRFIFWNYLGSSSRTELCLHGPGSVVRITFVKTDAVRLFVPSGGQTSQAV